MGGHALTDIDFRHASGQAAELFVAYRIAKAGYTVSRPFLTQCRYDLIFEGGGLLFTVQVKKASWSKSGKFSYLQCRLSRDKTRLDPDVDYFAFTDNEKVWIVEASELKGMTSVCLASNNSNYKPYRTYDLDEWWQP